RSHGDPTALVFGNAALVVVVEWPIGTGFASGMRQLDPGESSLRVHEFNDRCQRIALAIVPQPKILWRDATFRGHGRCFNDDGASSPTSQAPEVHHMPVGCHPVAVLSAVLTHGRNP